MSKITILGDTSGKIELVAANTISPNIAFTLPAADGSAGQVLATDGAGTLSFVTNDGTASFQAANSAGAYANAAFAAANSAAASSVDSTARAVANSLFDGTAEANVSSLISSGEITGQYFTIDNNGYYGDVGYGGYDLAITANVSFLVQTNAGSEPESGPQWVFGSDGDLTVPGNISDANTITANVITANTIVASNASVIHNLTVGDYLSVANVAIGWHTAPTTSKGSPGDRAGWCAIDDEKLYRCIADYTDGTEDIWVFVLFTGGEWG
jgi:hypothetical protein